MAQPAIAGRDSLRIVDGNRWTFVSARRRDLL